VAFSQQKFGARDSYCTWTGKFNGQEFGFFSLPVSWNFLDVMGIPIIEGRKPTESDDAGHRVSYIINKKLQRKLDAAPGALIHNFANDPNGVILGVVDNLKFASLRNSVDNMAFVINGDGYSKSVSYVRIKAGSNFHDIINHIRKTIAEIDPTFPAEIEFYDDIFNHLYQHEQNKSSIILLFSTLAVLISIVGVFGLILFETQTRKREIAIRKVHGATTKDVLTMFNTIYIKILLSCFVIAVLVSLFIVHRWLEQFAFKTPLYWWIFLLAGLFVFAITMITVNWQSYKAATANPVDAIKNE